MSEARVLRPLPAFIFASRWLQLPLYLGLIVAQAIYVWLFWQELFYLLMATFGDSGALSHILDSVSVPGATRPSKPNETVLMLVVLLAYGMPSKTQKIVEPAAGRPAAAAGLAAGDILVTANGQIVDAEHPISEHAYHVTL